MEEATVKTDLDNAADNPDVSKTLTETIGNFPHVRDKGEAPQRLCLKVK